MLDGRLKIAYNEIPKVLILGNGINRSYDFASWDSLIEAISTKESGEIDREILEKVPYPMQPVILTEDHVGTQMKGISNRLSLLRAPSEEETMLNSFASLPIDSILTTNYTYELEKALDNQFVCMPSRKCKARKVAYTKNGDYSTKHLHTCFVLEDYPPIWHIHGEAARHETMILGHYYYGKLLAKMQQYIPSLIARCKTAKSRQLDISIYSWLDYFMLGDIYIVGLGMALSELDLWWLINCKKRNFPDRKVVLYKPDIYPEEKLMAEAYGVVVETDGHNGDYKAYYKWVCEELSKKL